MAPQATHTGPKRIALEPTPQLPKEAFSGPKAHEAYAAVIKSHAKNAETARKVGDKPTAAHFTAKAAGMARNAAEKGHGHIEQGAKGGQYYVTPSGAKHYIGG